MLTFFHWIARLFLSLLENLRKSGPPIESDWWIKDTNTRETSTKKSSSILCAISSLSPSKRSESSGRTDSSLANSQHSAASGKFKNCGLSTWEESRQKWRIQTVAQRPSPPPPVNCDEVILGLTQVQRTFELPGRMKLSDIIDLLVEVWECDEKDFWVFLRS